jgi:pSer/pThr/pTyr-binding forkhead associated (FHA) protein
MSTSEKKPFLYDVESNSFIELGEDMIFGRSPSCDLTLNDDMVSSKHLTIAVRGNRVFITDLNSSNKTSVNGQVLEPNVKNVLHHGDRISFGHQKFAYFYEDKTTFKMPEFTKTHKFKVPTNDKQDNLDDVTFVHSNAMEVFEKVEKKDYIKLLKDSRQVLLDLETKSENIKKHIIKRTQDKTKEEELSKEIDEINSNLNKYSFKTDQDFEKEKNEYIFSENELTSSMGRLKNEILAKQEEIDAKQQELIKHKEQLEKVTKNIQFITKLHGQFAVKTDLDNKLSSVREEITIAEGLDLEARKIEVNKQLKKENEKYKYLQEAYGTDLKSRKRPASRNKDIKLGK